MSLRFLHISDIHFTKQSATSKDWDLDENIRNEVELDLEQFCRNNGNVNAILVGGDIAFSGSSGEYEKADGWLAKISSIVGCETENILTIPGNHDVDWSKIGEMLSATHSNLRSLNKYEVDEKLKKIASNSGDKESFFLPFENYYKFAAKYQSLPGDTGLFWEKEFDMSPIKIRVRGVNSAIVSNKYDDENTNKLILGSIQTDIKRQSNIVDVFMCHHPPEWLQHRVDIERDLNARCSIQLFGHVHREDSIQVNESLIIAAGAMHPERYLPDWYPSYNIIDIDFRDSDPEKYLDVMVWKRVYDKEKTLKFMPKFTAEGSPFNKYSLKLSKNQVVKNDSIAQPNARKLDKSDQQATHKPTLTPIVEVIDVNTKDPVRQLAYMFLSLPYHKRIKIAVGLELTEDEDEELPDTTRSQLYFKRAQQGNKLRQLWDQTTASIVNLEQQPNPF